MNNILKKTIKTNNPKMIWNELHKKVDNCGCEDCWLDLIEDEYLREDLKKDYVRPISTRRMET